MPLRRNFLDELVDVERFWELECRNVLVSYPTNKIRRLLNENESMELLTQFAKKFPEGTVIIEKRYEDDIQRLDEFILTIAFDEWNGDKIIFSIKTFDARGSFCVVYHMDIDRHFPHGRIYSHDCNLEQTLKNVEAFVKNFSIKRNKLEIKRCAKEREKENKIIEMTEKSIETIVPQMMASSGYEWNLHCNGIRYLSLKTIYDDYDATYILCFPYRHGCGGRGGVREPFLRGCGLRQVL